MKLGYLLLTFLFISFSVYAGICGPDASELKIIKNLSEVASERYCATSECLKNGKTFSRTRCFFQNFLGRTKIENVVMMVEDDVYLENGITRTEDRVETININKEDSCFNSCVPKKVFLRGVQTTLERSDCRKCLSSRPYPETDGSLNYPEVGKILYEGSKCFQKCIDPEGEIQKERILSQSCKECVGLDGHQGEKFFYILTQSGKCLEVDESYIQRHVDDQLCKMADVLYRTKYRKSRNLFQVLLQHEPDCIEVDVKTLGRIYSKVVSDSKCEIEESINGSDRSIPNDKKSTPQGRSTPRSSTRQ